MKRQPSGFETIKRQIGGETCSHYPKIGHDRWRCPSRGIMTPALTIEAISLASTAQMLPMSRIPVFNKNTATVTVITLRHIPVHVFEQYDINVQWIQSSQHMPITLMFHGSTLWFLPHHVSLPPVSFSPAPFLLLRQRCAIDSRGFLFYSLDFLMRFR